MLGAQFAVSQSVVDPNDPMWQNALDIIIPSLSVSAHKKVCRYWIYYWDIDDSYDVYIIYMPFD